jgi:hypothetical protein
LNCGVALAQKNIKNYHIARSFMNTIPGAAFIKLLTQKLTQLEERRGGEGYK